jgi:hypothetical protein
MNIRKKKNLQYSREQPSRIVGISGVGTGPESESRNFTSRNLIPIVPIDSSRDYEKVRYTQSNQRTLRIIRPYD